MVNHHKPQGLIIIFFLSFCCLNILKANSNTFDSTRVPKTSGGKKIIPTKKFVVFPSLLRGNEKESIEYVKKFSSLRRKYIIRMYHEGENLYPDAAMILKKYKIAAEFAILLALESAYDSNALSKAGAVGYWQLKDDVAREYGLNYCAQPTDTELRKIFRNKQHKDKFLQTYFTQPDERKNFLKSTHVAAKYIKNRLRNLDNNPLLVAASFNYGIGNIWKALAKTGKTHPTFWDIKKFLPEETCNYVMNFIGLNVLFHNYQSYLNKTLLFDMESCNAEETAKEFCQQPENEIIDKLNTGL